MVLLCHGVVIMCDGVPEVGRHRLPAGPNNSMVLLFHGVVIVCDYVPEVGRHGLPAGHNDPGGGVVRL